MKNLLKYIPVLTLAVLLWAGCEKQNTDLPPKEISEEVSTIAERYNKILVAATDGWVIAYKANNYPDTVYTKLKFELDQKVNVLAGYRNFHTLQSNVSYAFEGKHIPVISFLDNTIFGELARNYNGSQKFKINYVEDKGYFELMRSDGYDGEVFKLQKATTANTVKLDQQIDEVLAVIAFEAEQARLSEETRLKIKALAEISSDFFFYNLKTTDFSAAVNKLDTTARKLSLTYKETPTSAPTSVTVGYSIYPKGIKLTPAIAYGTVLVDSITLGSLSSTVLNIDKAGNAGAGAIGYMHDAPYPFTNVANRAETVAEVLYNTRESNNLIYTNFPDSVYSAQVLVLREALRQQVTNVLGHYTDTRFNFQLYFPTSSTVTATSMSLQVSARNAGNTANTFYALYAGLDAAKLEDNVLKYTLNGNAGNNFAAIRTDYETFFQQLFPAEGVTVVPYRVGTTTRFKLVSKKDSRIWVNYIHQLAAPRTLTYN